MPLNKQSSAFETNDYPHQQLVTHIIRSLFPYLLSESSYQLIQMQLPSNYSMVPINHMHATHMVSLLHTTDKVTI
jgi:hypothetical protein